MEGINNDGTQWNPEVWPCPMEDRQNRSHCLEACPSIYGKCRTLWHLHDFKPAKVWDRKMWRVDLILSATTCHNCKKLCSICFFPVKQSGYIFDHNILGNWRPRLAEEPPGWQKGQTTNGEWSWIVLTVVTGRKNIVQCGLISQLFFPKRQWRCAACHWLRGFEFSNKKNMDLCIPKETLREQRFSLYLRSKPVGWCPSMAGDSWCLKRTSSENSSLRQVVYVSLVGVRRRHSTEGV